MNKKKNIAVVYLARPETGCNYIKNFIKSYENFDSGYEHDLIVIIKSKMFAKKFVKNFFKGIKNIKFWMCDDSGFDLHKYFELTKYYDYNYYFFCNTYSEINTNNWLAKIFSHAKDEIGLIGTSASNESLYDSIQFLQKINFFITVSKVRFSKIFYNNYKFFINLLHPTWGKKVNNNFFASIKNKLGNVIYKKKFYNKNKDDLLFYDKWHENYEAFKYLEQFQKRPNPHIRSTGFLISKTIINKLNIYKQLKSWNDKTSVCLFESGKKSLTNQILDIGLDVVVVNSDGNKFDHNNFIHSNTFRTQINKSIILDNHIKYFKDTDKCEKKLLFDLTWGKNKILSIIIPTHNRNNLLNLCLNTIFDQYEKNCEIIIFDNCSKFHVKNSIDKKYIDKLKIYRSEVFLSVVDSWNKAISYASGDYLYILGDDDGIVPNGIKKIITYMKNCPDAIYAPTVKFFYPNTNPSNPEGLAYTEKIEAFSELKDSSYIDQNKAIKLAKNAINFDRYFSFNKQGLILSKQIIDSMSVEGKLFHTPYPDYYLTILLFLVSKKILFLKEPFGIHGISNKSFGYSLINNNINIGNKLLNNKSYKNFFDHKISKNILFDDSYLTNYFLTIILLTINIKKFNYLKKYNFKLFIYKYRLIKIHEISLNNANLKNIISKLNEFNSKFKLYFYEKVFIFFFLKRNKNFFYKKIYETLFNFFKNIKLTATQIPIDNGNCINICDLYNILKKK